MSWFWVAEIDYQAIIFLTYALAHSRQRCRESPAESCTIGCGTRQRRTWWTCALWTSVWRRAPIPRPVNKITVHETPVNYRFFYSEFHRCVNFGLLGLTRTCDLRVYVECAAAENNQLSRKKAQRLLYCLRNSWCVARESGQFQLKQINREQKQAPPVRPVHQTTASQANVHLG